MKKRYINIIIIILVILLAFSTYKIVSSKEKVEVDDNLYQYLSGIKYEYKGKTSLTADNNGIILNNKNINIDMDSTPIYYSKKDKVLLSNSMSVIFPKSNFKSNKLRELSYLNYDKKLNECDYSKGKYSTNITSGFIYDGMDLYILVNKGVLYINGEEINISHMSYIIANYDNNVILYNKESDEYKDIPLNDNNAYVTTNDFTINILYDSVKYNNKEQLLIKNIDILKNIDE